MKILSLVALAMLASLAHAGARQEAVVSMASDPEEARDHRNQDRG